MRDRRLSGSPAIKAMQLQEASQLFANPSPAVAATLPLSPRSAVSSLVSSTSSTAAPGSSTASLSNQLSGYQSDLQSEEMQALFGITSTSPPPSSLFDAAFGGRQMTRYEPGAGRRDALPLLRQTIARRNLKHRWMRFPGGRVFAIAGALAKTPSDLRQYRQVQRSNSSRPRRPWASPAA